MFPADTDKAVIVTVIVRDHQHVRTHGETCQCPWQMFQLMVTLLNIYFGCPWQKSDFEKMSTTNYYGGDPCLFSNTVADAA